MKKNKPISINDFYDSIQLWINTPAYSLLGQSFGNPQLNYIGRPMNTLIANDLLRKLKDDIPVLILLPTGSVNVYEINNGFDTKRIVLSIAGVEFIL